LLLTPPTATTTFPVVAPVGTWVTIWVALQLVIVVAAVPLNATVLVPCVEPKPVPVIVIEDPTSPDVGERLVILCAAASNGVAHRTTIEDKKMRTDLLVFSFIGTTSRPSISNEKN
jgi:hypothetical protein